LCKSKHWSHEPHVHKNEVSLDRLWLEGQKPSQPEKPEKPEKPGPKKSAVVIPREPGPMSEAERKRIVEQDDGTAAFVRAAAEVPGWKLQQQMNEDAKWDDCPRCEERRAKKAAAQKRWREKRRK